MKDKRVKLGGKFVAPVAEPASDLTPAQRAKFRKDAKAQAKKKKAKKSSK